MIKYRALINYIKEVKVMGKRKSKIIVLAYRGRRSGNSRFGFA